MSRIKQKIKQKVTRKRKYQRLVQTAPTTQLRAVLRRPSIFVTSIHLGIIRLELRRRGITSEAKA